ncbi:MAG: type II secretion system protein [Phycisphaeraceae bacterium]
MNDTRVRCRFRAAFTLVELLVVISIIALLISLLLPALRQARKTSQAVQCAANLRQVGYAFDIYAQENNDYMPSTAYAWGSWQTKLPTTGALGAPKVVPTLHWSFAHLYNRNVYEVLHCPAEPELYLATGGAPAGQTFTRFHHNYQRSSYDQNWTINRYSYGKPRQRWSLGPTEDFTPSEARFMTDAIGQSAMSFYNGKIDGEYTPKGSLANPNMTTVDYGYRHPNTTLNALYWDSHVRSHGHFSSTGERVFQELFKERP